MSGPALAMAEAERDRAHDFSGGGRRIGRPPRRRADACARRAHGPVGAVCRRRRRRNGGGRTADAGSRRCHPLSSGLATFRHLPDLIRAIRATANAVVARQPDVLVIIDSPDFTHRIARIVRARNPAIPIVDYVCPSVWAWRPGRARAMRGYVDHVLALLPFEPAALAKLDGPACTYVGHPLIEQIDRLRPNVEEAAAGAPTRRLFWCCREVAPARSAGWRRSLGARLRSCGSAMAHSNWCCRRSRTSSRACVRRPPIGRWRRGL